MMIIPSQDDYLAKVYFGEWYNTLQDMYLIRTKTAQLKAELKKYCEEKELPDEGEGTPGNEQLQQLQQQLKAAKTPEEKQSIQDKINSLQSA